MTNDMFLSLDLYKIVSDYSGVNQLKFPPTTIQILNALTAYIKDYSDSVKTLQDKVDNLTTDGLPNYMELENATSGKTEDSVITLNGIMNVENGANTVNGEYHISIPTDGTLKVTGLGKLGVDFVPKYSKKVIYYNQAPGPFGLAALSFDYISNKNNDLTTLYDALVDVYENYGLNVIIPCNGSLIPSANVSTNIIGFAINTYNSTSKIVAIEFIIAANNGISKNLRTIDQSTSGTYNIDVKEIFVPARTDTI